MRKANLLLLPIAGLALAACQITPPGLADRARDECREIARDQGYRNVQLGQAFGEERVSIRLTAERNGRDFAGSCIYDRRDREARLDLDRGGDSDGRLLSGGRDACRDEAQDRRYQIRSIDSGRVVGDSARFQMSLTRDGRRFGAYCRYGDGRADLEIERN